MTTMLYRARATASGGRSGRAVSDDDRLELALSVPASMGGDGGPGTNPEQLFSAGYAACFHGSLRLAARRRGAPVDGSTVTASVELWKDDAGAYDLAARLEVSLPNVPLEEARELAAEAHAICPYSRAIRGNVQVEIVVGVEK